MSDERMVLRTVYLPPELDEKLRVKAFRSKVTMNELIRAAVEAHLRDFPSFGEELKKKRKK